MDVERRPWLGLGRAGILILAALAAILLLSAVAIGFTTRNQQDARRAQLLHSNAMIALNAVSEATLEAESSQRGYLLTDRAEYLAPYEAARARLGERVDAARDAIRQSGAGVAEQRAFEALAAEVTRKLGELRATVDLAKSGQRDAALGIVQGDSGRRSMMRVRTLADAVITSENRDRAAAVDIAENAEQRLLPLLALLGATILGVVIFALASERRRSQAEGIAAQAEELREAKNRSELLARELNHRVKNLFSVILSIIALSSRQRPECGPLAEDIRARIHGLSLAHATSQGQEGTGGNLADLIRRILKPYVDQEGQRFTLSGPEIPLPSKAVTPMGLILHELATNAAKYGALGPDGQRLAIAWEPIAEGEDAGKITLTWNESLRDGLTITPAAPDREGFGTRLATLAARQLSGTVERDWRPEGLLVRLIFKASET